MVSSLALQMSLYFNTYFFPLWWVSCLMMLHVKVSLYIISALPWHCYVVNKSSSSFFLFQASVGVCEISQMWFAFCFQYSILPDYYKFIVITVIILITLIEAIRLYLGYMGNLQEKVGSFSLPSCCINAARLLCSTRQWGQVKRAWAWV
jgi:transmembrane protein 17